jgi:hypothetical protein
MFYVVQEFFFGYVTSSSETKVAKGSLKSFPLVLDLSNELVVEFCSSHRVTQQLWSSRFLKFRVDLRIVPKI